MAESKKRRAVFKGEITLEGKNLLTIEVIPSTEEISGIKEEVQIHKKCRGDEIEKRKYCEHCGEDLTERMAEAAVTPAQKEKGISLFCSKDPEKKIESPVVKNFCVTCDKPIRRRTQLISGYKLNGKLFVFNKWEERRYNRSKPPKGKMPIFDFVAMNSIDPLYFEKAYAVEPIKDGIWSYRDLTLVLEELQLGLIVELLITGTVFPHHAVLTGYNRKLRLILLYEYEIVTLPKTKVAEIDLEIIEAFRKIFSKIEIRDFNPGRHCKPRYKQIFQAIIEKKEKFPEPPLRIPPREKRFIVGQLGKIHKLVQERKKKSKRKK